MKRGKKLSVVLLLLLVLSQIPFAYRRYKLGLLNTAIEEINSERTLDQKNSGYLEYKGVIHVHSFLGGHSSGSFQDIIAAAKANGLNFVVMTEHPAKEFDTAELTLKGDHAGVLFVNGNEVRTREGDRLLLIPGDASAARADTLSTSDVLAQTKARGALAFVAYPEEFQSWALDGYKGAEVYNVYTNARRINPVVAFFDSLWAYRSYHDLVFTNFYSRPSASLKTWDEMTSSKKLVAIAGNDSHANIGMSLNDSSGNTLLGVKLDPYETSFHLVRVHVLLAKEKKLTTQTLLEALGAGHCFIGFDLLGDTSGFDFTATNSADRRSQGDEINLLKEVGLSVTTPVPTRIVLFKEGKAIQEENSASRKEFVIKEKGSYRVEAYLPQLGKPAGEQPWIISNPIYVR